MQTDQAANRTFCVFVIDVASGTWSCEHDSLRRSRRDDRKPVCRKACQSKAPGLPGLVDQLQ